MESQHMNDSGNATMATGRILFVGAGPGNPDLLTVRARDVLENTAYAWVDPAVTVGIRRLIAQQVEVPIHKVEAAEAEWELSLIHI